MAITIERIANWPQVDCGKLGWLSARPLLGGPFMWRIQDAWGVLTGKYDAMRFVSDFSKEEMEAYYATNKKRTKNI